MAEKEEITDMMADKVYTAKEDGDYVFYKGKVLKFDFEGSITSIKITKIDRKNKRMWGEHIELFDNNIVKTHYGHDVDKTSRLPWCRDCEVPVSEPSTEDGEVKAKEREETHLSDGTKIED